MAVFLTNTLDEAERRAESLFGPYRVISEEANAALEIKNQLPILAVIGNPPYSGHSANRSVIAKVVEKGEKYPVIRGGPRPEQRVVEMKTARRKMAIRETTFIGRLIDDYYHVDGERLRERNSKWLQNDYVKFVRWGQWRINKTGAGILAFVTDNSYLDGPTFRGMRQALMHAFSDIYILDLHGNRKKHERAPDGSADKNVFDITQGVAIAIFIKDPTRTASAKVLHADLWGPREATTHSEAKYPWLFAHDVANTHWEEIRPRSPLYLFKPRSEDLTDEYHRCWALPRAVPLFSMGITTGVNSFSTDFQSVELKNRVLDLAGVSEDGAVRQKYNLRDTSSFQLSAVSRNL